MWTAPPAPTEMATLKQLTGGLAVCYVAEDQRDRAQVIEIHGCLELHFSQHSRRPPVMKFCHCFQQEVKSKNEVSAQNWAEEKEEEKVEEEEEEELKVLLPTRGL